MASIKELVTYPLPSDYYGRFTRKGSDINLSRIDLMVFSGEERKDLKTPVNGDSTMVLRYKESEGVLLSLLTDLERLEITQFQGASGRAGYRLTTELRLANLFADQIETITRNENSGFKRICMPPVENIDGLLESSNETTWQRYKSLVVVLGLNYSKEEALYIRDVK